MAPLATKETRKTGDLSGKASQRRAAGVCSGWHRCGLCSSSGLRLDRGSRAEGDLRSTGFQDQRESGLPDARRKGSLSWSVRQGQSDVVAPRRAARWLADVNLCSWSSRQTLGCLALGSLVFFLLHAGVTRPAPLQYGASGKLLVGFFLCSPTNTHN